MARGELASLENMAREEGIELAGVGSWDAEEGREARSS